MATSVEPLCAHLLKLNGDPLPSLTFKPFDLASSNQRVLGVPHPTDTVTPLALRPSIAGRDDNTDGVDLGTAVEAVKYLQAQEGGVLTKLLARHGTLLFRGLPIHNAEDFSELATHLAPANESPKEVLIYSHSESPQVPHAPEYIFFYGHRVPVKGGETPISSSLELFYRAQRLNAPSGVWKEIQDGDDEPTRRRKIEAQISRYGRHTYTTWEWTDDGKTLVLTHRLPAIHTQPNTNLHTLFTRLAGYFKYSQGGRKNVTQQLYGDGTPIPEIFLERLAKITDEIRIPHKWRRGDVLVYDNIIAQHGRQPWEAEQADRVVPGKPF
ncbi:hypothetical protein MAP00_000367 [Monascus purpureus]|nr:hypothetical protein MAP00_000367 [Monascus purpureus]